MTRALKDVGKIDLGGIYFVRHDGALLDITPQCVLISITESILNPWLTIRVHINDSINLLGSLPMIGEEYIYVEFKTREDSFNMVKKAFKVSSIENKVRTKSRQDTYSVYGYSVEYFINRNSKVRKTFAGVTPSAIAQNIFSNHLTNVNDGPAGTIVKPFKVWGTDGLTTINAPNMQPLQFIQLLAKKSHAILVDPETGDRSVWADFVFFENMDGFYFYPKSGLRAGYGGLGDSFYYAPANQPGGDASYSDEYIEMKAKIEKDLKKFEKSVNSGELTDIAKQLGTSLGAVTGQLGDALSGAAGPLTTALQQGASTLTGVINSIVNGVILDGAGKPRHAELKKDKRFDSSTIIKSIEFNTQGAHQKMNDAGLFHNAIEVIDPIRKSVRRHDWHYENQFGEIGHTGLSQNPVCLLYTSPSPRD